MKILAIQSDVPFGQQTGKDIRDAAILGALHNAGALTLFALRKDAEAPDWLDVYPNTVPTKRNIWQRSNPFRPLSYTFSPDEKQELAEAIGKVNPDVAVLEGVMLRDALPILKAAGVPAVLDMHNIESDLLATQYKQSKMRYWPGNLLQEALRRPAAHREDMAAARKADQIWVCSAVDVEKLPVGAQVVPNPVPNSNIFDLAITPERYKSGALVFVGLLGYAPNRYALKTLCKDISPYLPVGAKLHIAGRRASASQRKMMSDAGAQFSNSPEDLMPILADAGFSLMPITLGGGTRIKVLEALAAGLVVIATAKAVEGLGLQDRQHYFNAETPERALSCLKECMKNPDLAAEVAQNGRGFVQEGYSQKAVGEAVLKALNRLTIV